MNLRTTHVGALDSANSLYYVLVWSSSECDRLNASLLPHEFAEDCARGSAVAIINDHNVFGLEWLLCNVSSSTVARDIDAAALISY